MVFAIVQLYLIIRLKNKKLSPYLVILLLQIGTVLVLGSLGDIYNQGRYAIGMFLFSIIHHAETKQKYNRLLIILIILMSYLHIVDRIILSNAQYILT